MISSLILEGSYRLKPPCNSDLPSPHCPFYPAWPPQKEERKVSKEIDCFCGSPIAQYATNVMAGLDESRFSISVQDAFHKVSEITPIHLPHIWNDCTGSTNNCILNVTTVSENVYDMFDEFVDAGTTYISASEIRMKLKSHQSFLQVTSDPMAINLDFNETDPSSKCKEINEKIYQLATDLVEPRRLIFYKKYGIEMAFEQDQSPLLPAGPFWIYAPLKFELKTRNGRTRMMVSSVEFKTSLNTSFKRISDYIPGMHYCKIISPARVLEWIYTDSLRHRLGLSAEPLKYILETF